MSFSTALQRAYRDTRYWVFLPNACFELRVGRRHPELDAWLARRGLSCWSLLTAWNPASCRLPLGRNRWRQARLTAALRARGFAVFAGENRAAAGDWPVEASCFVPGMRLREARCWARAFGQNAFLAAKRKRDAALLWTGRASVILSA